MEKYAVFTSTAEHFAEKVGNESDFNVIYLDKDEKRVRVPDSPFEGEYKGMNVFPNDEVSTKLNLNERDIESLSSGEETYIAVVHSGQPYPDKGLSELNSVLEWLRKDTENIHADVIFSHFPYQMQDDQFVEEGVGQVNKAESILSNLFRSFGDAYIDLEDGKLKKSENGYSMRIVAFNPHFSVKDWVDKYLENDLLEIENVSDKIKKVIKDYYNSIYNEREVVFVGPDESAKERLDLDFALGKIRNSSYDVEQWFLGDGTENICPSECIINYHDDTIETGTTLSGVLDTMKKSFRENYSGVDTENIELSLSTIHTEEIEEVRRTLDIINSGRIREIASSMAHILDHDLRKKEIINDSDSEEDYERNRKAIRNILLGYENLQEIKEEVVQKRGFDSLSTDYDFWVGDGVDIKGIGVNRKHSNRHVVNLYREILGVMKEGQEIAMERLSQS